MHGLERGAVYRPHKNRHYARRIIAGIEAGGKPVLATGKVGTRALLPLTSEKLTFVSTSVQPNSQNVQLRGLIVHFTKIRMSSNILTHQNCTYHPHELYN